MDEYGTQQPIALLKLLLEKGGMYDRGKDLILKYIRDIGFLAAMGKVWTKNHLFHVDIKLKLVSFRSIWDPFETRGVFHQAFCQCFSLTTVISYWNPCIWLAESKFVSEKHWQNAWWNAPQSTLFNPLFFILAFSVVIEREKKMCTNI